MKKKRGIFVETSRKIIKGIVEMCSLRAYADEGGSSDSGDGGTGEQPKQPTINYEDLIAKARKEEKDKQYAKIERLEAQVKSLTEQHNNDLLKIAEFEGKLESAEKKLATSGAGDSEELKTLKTELASVTAERDSLKKEVAGLKKDSIDLDEYEKELRGKIESEYAVKLYRVEQLSAHKADILVPELVMGETQEEIDKSIEAAIARSNEIKASLGVQTTPQQAQQGQGRTPKAPANPSTDFFQSSGVSLEKLATMDVSSPEYANLRKQLGLF